MDNIKIEAGTRVRYINPREIGPNSKPQKGTIPVGTEAVVIDDWEDGVNLNIELVEEFLTPSLHSFREITELRKNLEVI
jgi:hypothetical protein